MNLEAGTIVWCELDPVVGSEQGGRRPALIISSLDYSAAMSRMTIVVPCT
ncbi:MAG: type II toxin-antitoxin system PemK/MazF family toxin, partial [Candidatus Nanopelagicales bacterium]